MWNMDSIDRGECMGGWVERIASFAIGWTRELEIKSIMKIVTVVVVGISL